MLECSEHAPISQFLNHPMGCGCIYGFLPQLGRIPAGPIEMFCAKHELGQLLADERERIERSQYGVRP
jgi:hypothetical protein